MKWYASEPHYTYVHWSESGVPLYVGMTRTPGPRTNSHRSNCGAGRASKWWPVVYRIEWYIHEDRWAALRHEEQLINELRPRFNRTGWSLDEQWRREADREIQSRRFDALEPADMAVLLRWRARTPAHFDATFDAIGAAA